jgi:hypothetical protein
MAVVVFDENEKPIHEKDEKSMDQKKRDLLFSHYITRAGDCPMKSSMGEFLPRASFHRRCPKRVFPPRHCDPEDCPARERGGTRPGLPFP